MATDGPTLKPTSGGPESQYWRVVGAGTGIVVGMADADDRLSTMVSLVLHLEDLNDPGRFVFKPENAITLAEHLLEAARAAQEATP